MEDQNVPLPDNRDRSIADAESLFRDDSAPRRPKPTSKPVAGVGGDYGVDETASAPSPPVIPPVTHKSGNAGDDYDVEGPTPAATRRPTAPAGSEPRVGRTPKPDEKSSARVVQPEPSESVEEVWSRGAEWGGTIALLVLVISVDLGLLAVLFMSDMYGMAFLVVLLSLPLLLAVCYPILITLERPVRVTPEQAVKDYYTALSHHFPHYRRMWLLLSSDGRVSGSFASFEGLRAYWKNRLNELRGGRAGAYTPLKFEVEDFRSEKSAGLSRVEATYTVNVFIRGSQSEGPVGSFRVASSLVKGPDRMWYMNRGTLP